MLFRSSTMLSGYGFPATLTTAPVKLNFQGKSGTSIDEVRKALDVMGNANVQTVGNAESSTFQIRFGIKDGATQASLEDEVKGALAAYFGSGNVEEERDPSTTVAVIPSIASSAWASAEAVGYSEKRKAVTFTPASPRCSIESVLEEMESTTSWVPS